MRSGQRSTVRSFGARLALALAVLAGAGAGAACTDDPGVSDGAPPGAAGPPPTAGGADVDYDACVLVPVEIVNRNLGLDLPAGHPEELRGDPRECQYGEFDATGNVLVGIFVEPTTTAAEAVFADRVAVVSAFPFEGLGDEAAEAPFSSRVLVREGNVVVDAYAVSGDARLTATSEELRALAAELLGIAETQVSSPVPVTAAP